METIYFGGKILTMEEDSEHVEAILVKNGYIIKTGTLKEILDVAGKHAEKKNLNGTCLMPAFIDTHSHVVMNGQMSIFADLSECYNFDDIKRILKNYIKKKSITNKQIVIGFGYDHNFLEEEEHPNKSVLDEISNDIPIIVLHVSGHLACVNSAMLDLAGINNMTPDPNGGKIGRIKGCCEPNGYLEEAAIMNVQQLISKRTKVKIRKLIEGMQQNYIENGVTTVQDGASNNMTLNLLRLANRLGLLKVDVIAYPMLAGLEKDVSKKISKEYKRHLKIGGYKLILDGSPQGRSAWLSKPYLGEDKEYCGYQWLPDDKVQQYILKSINDNAQILAHCNGDAASEQFLNAYDSALKKSTNPNKYNLRPVMIHCQTVRNDQLDRMKLLNMIPSIFVGHVFYWGDVHLRNLGEKRGKRISPVKDALDRNLVINFHQDTPVTKPSALFSVWCAVNRISRNGELIGEKQKIDVYEALKAVTINAAYEYFEENFKGSIKEGKRADLVILDTCPLDIDPIDIKKIKVLETIKDGKTIFLRK